MITESPAVVLELNQTAEPNQCGSCHFFGRRGSEAPYLGEGKYNRGGYCTLRLPPQYAIRDQGEGAPSNWCNDNDGCDLWRSAGRTFIVSRKITP